MKTQIEGRYGRAHSNEMRLLLGLADGAKLPVAGMPEREIQGIRVYVRPLLGDKTSRRRSAHRVRAICPKCGKDISAGRIHQHMPIHRAGA